MAASPPARSLDATDPIARRIGGQAVWRPLEQPPLGVPVALRSAQHSGISAGRFTRPNPARMVLAKWVLKGEGEMGIAFKRVKFRPGEVAIYLPSIPHQFWAVQPTNEMCWFSVDGPLCEEFVRHLNLAPGVYACPPPIDQIHELMANLSDHTVQGQRKASMLAMALWYHIANAIRAPEMPTAIGKVQQIIQQQFSNPELTAQSIAATLGYHRGSLSRLFHRHTGITIIDYLTQVRLQAAKSLLIHTPDKVAEIGNKCGFRESAYFCRWLRKHTGQTPTEVRNTHVT